MRKKSVVVGDKNLGLADAKPTIRPKRNPPRLVIDPSPVCGCRDEPGVLPDLMTHRRLEALFQSPIRAKFSIARFALTRS